MLRQFRSKFTQRKNSFSVITTPILSAFALLKTIFKNWDFVSQDVAYAKATINRADPNTNRIPIFDLLDLATANTHVEHKKIIIQTANALLQLGADLNARHYPFPYEAITQNLRPHSCYNSAPLHFYMGHNSEFTGLIVDWLIKNGADANAPEDNLSQYTPLMLARLHNTSQSIWQTLIEVADPFIKDKCDKSTLEFILYGISNVNLKNLVNNIIRKAIQSALKKESLQEISQLFLLEEFLLQTKNQQLAKIYLEEMSLELQEYKDNPRVWEFLANFAKPFGLVSTAANFFKKQLADSIIKLEADLAKKNESNDIISLQDFFANINEIGLLYKQTLSTLRSDSTTALTFAYFLKDGKYLTNAQKYDLLKQISFAPIDTETAYLKTAFVLATMNIEDRLFVRKRILNWTSPSYKPIINEAMRSAVRLNEKMLSEKITLFKAYFISQLSGQDAINAKTSLKGSDLDFLLLYKKKVIKTSKVYREQILQSTNAEEINELIEKEEKELNKILTFNASYKKTIHHKTSKRRLLQRGSIAEYIDVTGYPFAIRAIASKVYAESYEFNNFAFIKNLNLLYENKLLKPIIDYVAQAAITRKNFNIVMLDSSNVLSYTSHASQNTVGLYNGGNSICIATRKKCHHTILACLLHELIHFIQQELYHNSSRPFSCESDGDKYIKIATKQMLKLIYTKLEITYNVNKSTYESGKIALKTFNSAIKNNPADFNDDEQFVLNKMLGTYSSSYTESNEYEEIIARYLEIIAYNKPSHALAVFLHPISHFRRDITQPQLDSAMQLATFSDKYLSAVENKLNDFLQTKGSLLEHKNGFYVFKLAAALPMKDCLLYVEKLSSLGLSVKVPENNLPSRLFHKVYKLEIHDRLQNMLDKVFTFKQPALEDSVSFSL